MNHVMVCDFNVYLLFCLHVFVRFLFNPYFVIFLFITPLVTVSLFVGNSLWMDSIYLPYISYCGARATLWFCPVFFFSYAADLGLFPEIAKSLTCAVFTESVDLRPDWWIWHYILESSAELLSGAKKDGFCWSTSQSLWCAKWSGVM